MTELRVMQRQVRGTPGGTYGHVPKYWRVSIYSDRDHTCTCPSYFFENTKNINGWCKHIIDVLQSQSINADIFHNDFDTWELLKHDDRQDFKEAQTRLYDQRGT